MEDISAEVRSLLLVRGFAQTSLYPTPVDAIQISNYFADALAPVWGGFALDKSVLKRAGIPRNRKIQAALDRLVGRGMLVPSGVSYDHTLRGPELRCSYELNDALTRRFADTVSTDPYWADAAMFVAEVAMAVSTLGNRANAGMQLDASYSDPLLDIDTVVDLDSTKVGASRTIAVNERIGALAAEKYGRSLEAAELTNLYLRHLLNLSFSAGDPIE